MPEPTTRDRLDPAGLAVMVLCCFLWGGNAVAVKYAVPSFPPVGCSAVRFVLGLPVVALMCRATGQPLWFNPKRPAFWGLWLVHGTLAALQIGTYNWGTSYSEAGRSAVFINVHPLIVAPFAWLVLGERLGKRGMLGLATAAAGVAALLAEPLRRGGGGFVGDLVVLVSAAVFASQTIAQKLTFPFIPPATLLLSQSVAAAVIAGTYTLTVEGRASYHPDRAAVLGVLYQGLAVSGFCFATWMILLRRYPAAKLSTIAFLTPLFGVALGTAMRGEALTPALLVGGLLVGLGIFLVSSDRIQRAQPDLALPGEDAP